MCLESGAYVVNMSKCSKCSKKNLKVEQVPAEALEEDMDSDDDTEQETETVIYNHVCADCNHVVSRHKVGEKLSKYSLFTNYSSFGWKTTGRSTAWTVFYVALQKTASRSCQLILGKLLPWSPRKVVWFMRF